MSVNIWRHVWNWIFDRFVRYWKMLSIFERKKSGQYLITNLKLNTTWFCLILTNEIKRNPSANWMTSLITGSIFDVCVCQLFFLDNTNTFQDLYFWNKIFARLNLMARAINFHWFAPSHPSFPHTHKTTSPPPSSPKSFQNPYCGCTDCSLYIKIFVDER